VVWTGAEGLSRTQYRYGHTNISAPGVAPRERLRNSIFQQVEHQLTSELRLIALVDAAVSDERLGAVTARSYGETLTGLARWMRRDGAWDLFLQGGPSVGLIQPSGAASDTGFGGSSGRGSPGLGGPPGRPALQHRLPAEPGRGGGCRPPSLTADAERTPTDELTLRGSLQASADRVSSDFFGEGANRLLQANLNARWRRYDLLVQGGLTSGMVGQHEGWSGDGLFIPAPFDSHTGFASATLLAPLYGGFDLTVRTRYLEIRIPDRERQWEAGLLGRIGWTAGGLVVSVEDEYVRGGGDGAPSSQNRLFLRLSRAFGTRF
jgi:hypothetical protein